MDIGISSRSNWAKTIYENWNFIDRIDDNKRTTQSNLLNFDSTLY
jgi:hypothetical protein